MCMEIKLGCEISETNKINAMCWILPQIMVLPCSFQCSLFSLFVTII